MLRVGLTGGLGSGKSTAAALFAAHGAHILAADEIARALMQPGQPVYADLVEKFGPDIVLPDGRLDRPALARIAFTEGRAAELNAIVHPATIARQAALSNDIVANNPDAVVIVESALIFETKYGDQETGKDSAWRHRFDRLILVTAPEELRVARFIARAATNRILAEHERSALEADARRRMTLQLPDGEKAALCDYVLTNNGPLIEMEWQIDQLWPLLLAASS